MADGIDTLPATMDKQRFGLAFWAIGGVSAVVWATLHKHKGRFWWFVGGSIVGSAIGYIIDESLSTPKYTPYQKTLSQ